MTDTDLKDRSPLEVIVLSFVFSGVGFGLVTLFAPTTVSSATLLSLETTPLTAVAVFAVALVVGVVGYTLVGVWVYLGEAIEEASLAIRKAFGLEVETFGPVTTYFMRQLWKTRDKNDVIVTTKLGDNYQGMLGSYSIKPNYEILLIRRETRAILKFTKNDWIEVKQWAVLFREEDISRIHAVAT